MGSVMILNLLTIRHLTLFQSTILSILIYMLVIAQVLIVWL